MKERPILFSAPMVRALLAGTKTQTRRVVKWRAPQEGLNMAFSGLGVERTWSAADGAPGWVLGAPSRTSWEWRSKPTRCPHGASGDRLWVRETCLAREQLDGLDDVQYLADMAFRPIEDSRSAADAWVKLNHYGGRGKGHVVPAIHMPRWASRITLEVTGVRVERLQDISEADAVAEGIHRQFTTGWFSVPGINGSGTTARAAYALLWDSINGHGSWALNPWVWVIAFTATPPAR